MPPSAQASVGRGRKRGVSAPCAGPSMWAPRAARQVRAGDKARGRCNTVSRTREEEDAFIEETCPLALAEEQLLRHVMELFEVCTPQEWR